MAKIIPFLFSVLMLAGLFTSCKHYPTEPPHHCDTCCDTCHKHCDTCDTNKPPCDTCNINKDSAAHAFVWTEYTLSDESSLTGVAVFGPNNIYVFGNNLHVFNGTSWNTYHPIVDGTSGRTVDFIDKYVFSLNDNYWVARGGIIYTSSNETVVTEYRLTFNELYGGIRACWGVSESDMFFVGDSGGVTHYDGTTFTKMPRVTTKNLRSVWGTSHNDVWAVNPLNRYGRLIVLGRR